MKKTIVFTASAEYQALLNKANMLDKIMAKVAQQNGIEVSAVTMEMLSDYFDAVSNQEGDAETTAALQATIDTLTAEKETLTTEVDHLQAEIKTKDDRIEELEKLPGADAVVPVPDGDANSKESDPYLAIANDASMSELDRIEAVRKLRNQ